MKKPAILIIGPFEPPIGGMATFLKNIMDSYLSKKYDIFILDITGYRSRRGGIILRGIIYQIYLLFKLSALLVKRKPRIAHIQMKEGFYFYRRSADILICKLLGIKIIIHIHGSRFKEFCTDSSWLTKFSVRFMLSLADKIIVLSRTWQELLSHVVVPYRLVSIPNGLFVSDFTARPNVKRGLGLREDKIVVLFLGGISLRKGTFDILETIKRYGTLLKDVIFVMAGPPDIMETPAQKRKTSALFKQIINESGVKERVIYTKILDNREKLGYFSSADIFLCPSHHENFPYVMIEAMAAALPLVITDVGGVRDAIEDGVNGFIIKPGDIDTMACKIKELAEDAGLRKKMGEKNRLIAKERYDMASVAEKVDRLYENILATKRDVSIPSFVYRFNEIITGRPTLRYLEELNQTQWYSAQELEELQLEKLKKILIHAYRNVPYYREIFKKVDFDPYKMNDFNGFKKVPLLTKEDINMNPKSFIAVDRKRKLTRSATSGSTGRPLIFYMCNDRIASDQAAHFRSRNWWGIRLGDREAVLWGNRRDVMIYNIIKHLRDNLLNTHLLPAFNMGEDTMRRYIKFLRRYRPRHIFGYAHSVYLLARYAVDNALRLNDIGIRVIFVTADMLHEFQKAAIEEAFGCPVANGYGGRDGGFIAHDCPHKNMHITADLIYLENIKDGLPVSPGEKGEIVITHLSSYGMPFIRYRMGDEAILSEPFLCKCGRSLPVLKNVLGRDSDYIVTPKKEFIHSLALIYIFREIRELYYFKVMQIKEDELIVYIVKNDDYSADTERLIDRKIKEIIGMSVKIIFKYIGIEEIPQEDKYKYIESKIVHNYISNKK